MPQRIVGLKSYKTSINFEQASKVKASESEDKKRRQTIFPVGTGLARPVPSVHETCNLHQHAKTPWTSCQNEEEKKNLHALIRRLWIEKQSHREVTFGWWHPQIRATGVKNHSELLRRGTNGYFTVILSIQVILQRNNIGFLSASKDVLKMMLSNWRPKFLKPHNVIGVQLHLFKSNPTQPIVGCTEHKRKQQGPETETQHNHIWHVSHVNLPVHPQEKNVK